MPAPAVGLRALFDLQAWSPNISRYQRDIAQITRVTSGSVQQVGVLKTASVAAAAGLGVLTYAGISAVRSLGDVTEQALTAYEAYERLGIALTNLAAREMRSADESLSMADALEQAAPRAKELLEWVQMLAVKSPFTQAGVAEAFRMSVAFGFTTRQAQRLTQSMVDFAAGSGASQEQLDRIALALGQMRAEGVLNARQMRQLSMAGLPVTEMLAKGFGVTTKELIRMRAAGLIPASKAIEIIIGQMEHDFAGAAERQATTWAGLRSTFEDIKEIGLREAFGGVFEAVQPMAAKLVDTLSSDETRARLRASGKAFGEALTESLGLVGGVARDVAGQTPGRWERGQFIKQPTTLEQIGQNILQQYVELNQAAKDRGEAMRKEPEAFQTTLRQNTAGFYDWMRQTLPGQVAGSLGQIFQQQTGIRFALSPQAREYLGQPQMYGSEQIGPPTMAEAIAQGYKSQYQIGMDLVNSVADVSAAYKDQGPAAQAAAEAVSFLTDEAEEEIDDFTKDAYELFQKQAQARDEFMRSEARALEDYNLKVSEFLADSHREDLEAETEYYADRADKAADFQEDVRKAEEDHQRDMRQMQRKHNATQEENIRNNDAIAYLREERRYEQERQDAEENYQLETQRRNREYAVQLRDMETHFRRSREKRTADNARQLADMQRQFDRERRRRQEDFDIKQAQERADFQRRQEMAAGYYALMGADFQRWLEGLKAGINGLNAAVPDAYQNPNGGEWFGAPYGGFARGGGFDVPWSHGYERVMPIRISGGEHVEVTPAGAGRMNVLRLEVDVRADGALSDGNQRGLVRAVTQIVGDIMEQHGIGME